MSAAFVLFEISNILGKIMALNVRGLPLLTILHAIWASWYIRKTTRVVDMKPLEALVSTFILCFGGSTMTCTATLPLISILGIMLGKPWGWIQNSANFPIYVAAIILMYYGPNDLLFRTLE